MPSTGTCPLCVYHLQYFDDSRKETHVFQGASGCRHSDFQPCDLCFRLAEGEQRIQDTKAALLRTIEDQRQLRTELNHRNDPMLSQLPIEVACRIFQLSIPPSLTLVEFREQLTTNGAPNFASPKSLLKLGAVSHTWRQIAWSYPHLWRDIYIASTSVSHISRVEEWIQRSGDLSLNICADIKYSPNAIDPRINSLIHIFGSVTHRWALFYASFPPSYGMQLVTQFNRATNVQGFALSTMKRNYRSVDDITGGENLVFLLMSGYMLKSVTTEWHNLTHFVGEYMSVGASLAILRNAPRVLDCTLRDSVRGGISEQTLLAHSLKSLHLRGCASDILKFLELPSLKELTLLRPEEGPFPNMILPFILHSGCHLEVVVLGRQTDVIDDYSEFFRLCPSLIRLELEPYFDGDWAFSRLAELLSPHNIQILPNLQSLTYQWSDSTAASIPWEDINAMVQTISSQPDVDRRPLTEICFVVGRLKTPEAYFGLEDLERVQELASQGLNFRISSQEPAIDIIQVCKDYQERLQKGVD